MLSVGSTIFNMYGVSNEFHDTRNTSKAMCIVSLYCGAMKLKLILSTWGDCNKYNKPHYLVSTRLAVVVIGIGSIAMTPSGMLLFLQLSLLP